MIYDPEIQSLGSAIADFRRARSQAQLKELFSLLTGDSDQLLSYDEVRQTLRLQGGIERGLKDIPLNAIVGSVGRYTDFTRQFLPRAEVSPERWARVKTVASGMLGLPPIEVYQIGEVYFVKDGNHRVSVARQMGADTIQAYVTEVSTRVPLSPDLQPDDLILKAEYSRFLELTNLDRLRPDADLTVTIPGQHQVLLEHIAVHRYYMGQDLQRDISYEEAVTHWYDSVYLPVVEIIRNLGILHHFPNRTETDLYLWLAEHRAQLEEQYGWPIRMENAASHMLDQAEAENLGGRISRLVEIILPDRLEDGPPAGQWRKQVLGSRPLDSLFQDILTPINGKEDGWCALEQALVIAQREQATLLGLHVVTGKARLSSQRQAAIQAEFDQRCQAAGVGARLVWATGDVVTQTCQRARLADLVVVNLSYPPEPKPLARLSSGFRDLIQRCPSPILVTPRAVSSLGRAVLAYDGSPKAEEALFIATYLAEKFHLPLVVVHVAKAGVDSQAILEHCQTYLEAYHVQATYVAEQGDPAQAILKTCAGHQAELLIMGGYGLSPVMEVFLGSTVDRLLRASRIPMLICR